MLCVQQGSLHNDNYGNAKESRMLPHLKARVSICVELYTFGQVGFHPAEIINMMDIVGPLEI